MKDESKHETQVAPEDANTLGQVARLGSSNYRPVGSIVINRVYSKIDKVFDSLGLEYDETLSQMVVDAICQDSLEICYDTKITGHK